MSAWFGGTKEGAPDVAIWSSTRNVHGWSRPIELARESEIATYNPVLFHTKDGRLWLYYKFGPHPTSWTGARRFSRDEGKTWSPIEHLPAGLYGPIRAKPLVLDNGTVVSGTSVESYRSWACWIERSADNGKTFAKVGPIAVAPQFVKPVESSVAPNEAPTMFDWSKTEGIIQPSVVWLGGHNLRFYARAHGQNLRCRFQRRWRDMDSGPSDQPAQSQFGYRRSRPTRQAHRSRLQSRR